jgi:hypothetical protein
MRFIPLALALTIGVSTSAMANLVTNGDFTSFTSTSPNGGQIGYNATVLDWTSAGYNFIYAPFPTGSKTYADNGGAPGDSGTVEMWGPGDTLATPVANGLTAPPTGNWVAEDSGARQGAISQTITGLTVGEAATLTFYWAASQQDIYSGATTDVITASLGTQSFSTSILSNVSKGFTAGGTASFTFTPTSSTEVLSFLAAGTPPGVPPFAMLSDISLTQVPEPAGLAVFGVALLGLAAYRLRRQA